MYTHVNRYVPGGFSRNLHAVSTGTSNDDVDARSIPEGLPTEQEYLAMYCKRAGRPMVPPNEWAFWKALTLFRIAAINHGVFARALAGNAGSSKALTAGPTIPMFISLALWQLDAAAPAKSSKL